MIYLSRTLLKSSLNTLPIYSYSQMNKLMAYEILGLKEPSTYEDLKITYLKLSKKYHPDINSDPLSIEKFKEINNAYSTLKNLFRSFEEGGHSFSIDNAKYNKYDGIISKEDYNIFKKYMKDKEKIEKNLDKITVDLIENEWNKKEEQIFKDIFGKSYQEDPNTFWAEENQNLREIYEDEIEKLFQRNFVERIQSIEKKMQEKMQEVGLRKPPKSKDQVKFRNRISNVFKKI